MTTMIICSREEGEGEGGGGGLWRAGITLKKEGGGGEGRGDLYNLGEGNNQCSFMYNNIHERVNLFIAVAATLCTTL